MMLRRIKAGSFVVSLIVVLFIASWAMGATSVDTRPVKGSEEPVKVFQDSASAAMSEQPTLPQASPNEVDGVEDTAAPFYVVNPELRVAGRNAAPIEENESAESLRLLRYLRWKHNAVSEFDTETATSAPPSPEKTRLQAYLTWAHLRDGDCASKTC